MPEQVNQPKDAADSVDAEPLLGVEGDLAGPLGALLSVEVAALVCERIGESADRLVGEFYRAVPPSDIHDWSAGQLAGILASAWELAQTRERGKPAIRIFNPHEVSDGWVDPHTAVQIINDDMPFIVDSVSAAVTRAGFDIETVMHPILMISDDGDPRTESWVHIGLAEHLDKSEREDLTHRLSEVLSDVRSAVADWPAMTAEVAAIASDIKDRRIPSVPSEEVAEAAELLEWLAHDNFTLLGYREYRVQEGPSGTEIISLPKTGLGVLRSQVATRKPLSSLPPTVAAKALDPKVLVLAKANRRSTVHRPSYLDYIGVKQFDADGRVVGEKRIVGLLAASTYAGSATTIPVARNTVRKALELSGFPPTSHSARDLLQFAETYPRDELLQITPQELLKVAQEVQAIGERRQTRVFLRNDAYNRFVSALVYLPRDRYTTEVRTKLTHIMQEAFHAQSVEFVARVSESVLARLHFVIRMAHDQPIPQVSEAELAAVLAAATRTWDDDFALAMTAEHGPRRSHELVKTIGARVPESYKEDIPPTSAVFDLLRLEGLAASHARVGQHPGLARGRSEFATRSSVYLHQASLHEPRNRRFSLFRTGQPVELFAIVPVFASLGAQVLEERPYEFAEEGTEPMWIYDVALRLPDDSVESEGFEQRFCEAYTAIAGGMADSDPLNQLVTTSALTWKQVSWLRAWIRYARQLGSPFSLAYFERVATANPRIAADLVELFEARFDPQRNPLDSTDQIDKLEESITEQIDAVTSLDADRMLRQLLGTVKATLRTNAFQVDMDGLDRPTTTIKVDPRQIPGVPSPVPTFEIWVSSPRITGVHLRFGAVARGGLRWSDRPEDMRTEILGLVKAQAVKNAVIVPVGAKGGFYVRRPVDPSDRVAWMEQGISCYREFINALLDVTDNLVDGQAVPPRRTVRWDEDDPYLVVAADKGTAAFSDIANEISLAHGFWLGDAFASGGSNGYDHKVMGITAKGAWESVKRHFRERGVDVSATPFTVAGIGDMSGDVFGNGMLCSDQIKLVAAFDHRDIFLDPDPDVAASFAERQRIFDLARSSWADYNPELISKGGGVFSRKLKSIPLSDDIKAVLGIPASVRSLTPGELVTAILESPVDLLWNGGIGTYVKASNESDLEVGDKANDAVRVNGRDLRCAVIGEGGNLGLTQRGRIEAARAGVALNTDAIDNSAGVDCSDHEVNIKILLDAVVARGDLTEGDRNSLLHEMTDEVAAHVLEDNYRQNAVLGRARAQALILLPVHRRLIDSLEKRGLLDRGLEVIPTDAEMEQLESQGLGLSCPELCVLLSYVKIALTQDLVDSPLADESWFTRALEDYFPVELQQRYPEVLANHQLRRQIIATCVANEMVDSGGISYVHRAIEETGATRVEIARAFTVSREVFGLDDLWHRISALDGQIPTAVQDLMMLEVRRLLDRSTRWVLSQRGGTVDVAGEVERFGGTVASLADGLSRLLVGSERSRLVEKAENYIEMGAPKDLAYEVSGALDQFSLLDIHDIAARYDADPVNAAEVYFAVSEHYGIDALLERISTLERGDRWSNLARASLRSDLYSVLAGLTSKVLRSTSAEDVAESRVAAWEERNSEGQQRARATIAEIESAAHFDLATLSVAVRTLRTLVSQGGGSTSEKPVSQAEVG